MGRADRHGFANPDPNRAGPSTLVKVGELEHILIDLVAGRPADGGSRFDPASAFGVLVTHLHSDHLTDLNDVIILGDVPGPRELKIVGPPRSLDSELTLAALEPDMGYRIAHHDDLDYRPAVAVTEVEPGDVFELGSASVSVFETIHAPVHPTVGFRIEHDGKVAALAGDTIPCDGLDALVADADDVQTVIRDDLVKLVPNERMGTSSITTHRWNRQPRPHPATAQRLLLTHLVPSPQPAQYDEWKSIAADHSTVRSSSVTISRRSRSDLVGQASGPARRRLANSYVCMGLTMACWLPA